MGVKERRAEMIALREAGMTYREIGERFGTSLQNVYRIIHCEAVRRGKSVRIRKANVDIEKIAYEGIYNVFVSDYKMTVTSFTRIALGRKWVDSAEVERIRRFIHNCNDVRVSVRHIQNICDYIGEPFESGFRLRKRKDRGRHENDNS